jgi:mannose-6-phosphate isomerase-like protein (cupin superfamily)
MGIRRVVTGHDEQGKAVFASDEEVEPRTMALLPGFELHWLWGGDTEPDFPDSGAQPPTTTWFPPLHGFRFGFFTLPPAGTAEPTVDPDAGLAEANEKAPGLIGHIEPDNPGMHTSATIDFEVVMSGECVLELDDGAERVLRPGDTVVQNGTRHRWHNRGDVPCTLAVILLGATHRALG